MTKGKNRAAATTCPSTDLNPDTFEEDADTGEDEPTPAAPINTSNQLSSALVTVLDTNRPSTSVSLLPLPSAAAAVESSGSSQYRTAVQVRPSKPEIYKADKQQNPEHWISSVEIYHLLSHCAAEDQVLLASTFMQGPLTRPWFESYRRKHGAAADWTHFRDAFLQRFVGPERELRARIAFQSVTQGGDSLLAYNSRVADIDSRIVNMHDTDRVCNYLRGLNAKLAEHVIMKSPTSLDNAMQLATVLDGQLEMIRAIHDSNQTKSVIRPVYGARPQHWQKTSHNLAGNHLNNIESQTSASEVNAVDKPYFSRPRPTVSRLPHADARRCRIEGLCFNCKQSGHTKDACLSAFRPFPGN
jgi:Retrotransposon gag protein